METTELNQGFKKIKKRPYKVGWRQMKKYFLPLLLIVIILCVANMPSGIFSIKGHSPLFLNVFAGLFGFAYSIFVLAPIEFGANLIFVKACRNEKWETEEIFQGFKASYLNIILASLLVLAIVVAGFISLIIPGIIFACRLAFVSYLVMDKNLDPVRAVEKSWQMTKGHGWRIFFMGLLVIPILILGLILFIVGFTVSVMWIKTAFASYYVMLDAEKNGEAARLKDTNVE
jgi:uncharacterized membrane protein